MNGFAGEDSLTFILNDGELDLIIVEMPYCGVSTKERKWRSGTLGAILSRYKFSFTKRIHGMGYCESTWQSRFYDRIIRNEKSWYLNT